MTFKLWDDLKREGAVDALHADLERYYWRDWSAHCAPTSKTHETSPLP